MEKSKKINGVYAIAGQKGDWSNVQLTKECGIIPYLLYKRHGYDCYMVGEKSGDYPHLDTYLNGVKMEFVDDVCGKSLFDYIIQNHKHMDLLIFRGIYHPYVAISDLYKKLRPDGKIVIYLDANSHWMDRILINEIYWTTLLNNCDIIFTSCKKLQKHLNIKWASWNIEYMPNGFYNFSNFDMDVDYEKKQNIIITTARIGTYQKSNHILLEAFALLCAKLSNWHLKLIGKVEDSFKKYIEEYFIKYPHLSDKVTFTGFIGDKEKLWNEYKTAKIFALTSCFEGGSPNVVAEAQINGCYMITSDIDASDDITDNERCGKIFPIGDIQKLYEILLDVCTDEEELKKASYETINYAKRLLDWEHNIDRLNYIINLENIDLMESI